MAVRRRWRALPLLLAATIGAVSSAGCAGSAAPARSAEAQGVAPRPLSDAEFAGAALRALGAPDGSEERGRLISAVVRTQLHHAAEHFSRGQDERGTRAVVGALLLRRAAEAERPIVGERGGPEDRALEGAIRWVSARGDEGQAQALLELRRASAKDADLPAVEESLRAIAAWARDSRTGSPVEIAGLAERAAVGRALLDPSAASTAAAEAAISTWIEAAVQNRLAYQQTGKRPPPREGIEATRALGAGPATLVALHLRHGDPEAALAGIERTSARRVVSPAFYAVVQGAVSRPEAARPWRAMWAAIEEETGGQVGGDFGMETTLFEAARMHVALEAWRREPEDPAAALVLAGTVASFGMPEVAPLLVTAALRESQEPQLGSAVMRLCSIALREHVDDPTTARRIYASASEALTLVEAPSVRAKVQPTPADVHELMGGIELRAGHLEAARPLLERVAKEAPSSGAFLSLSLLERQAQRPEAALGWTTRARSEPFASAEPLAAAEASVVAYEIHRSAGAAAEAAAALEDALRRSLALGPQSAGAPRARALRLLARVLDAYGDARGATRAHERALAEVAGDRRLLGATLLDGIARAVVRRDLDTGRALLRRAIEARVEADDLVYGALWVRLLEATARATPDGTVAAALDAGTDAQATSWTGKLARWAAGKLSDADLSRLAQTGAQRVEASFYLAMQRRVAGDAAADAGLREVATSAHLDLVEVQLARELLFPPLELSVPKGVKLP